MALAMSVEGGQQLPSTSRLPSEAAPSLQRRAGPTEAAAAAASASLAGRPGAAMSEQTDSKAAATDVSQAARESSQTSRGGAYPVQGQVGCGTCRVICKLWSSRCRAQF